MVIAYAKSDVGKLREMNQGAYYISDSLSEVKLYLLADGMGGYKGGEIASNLAVIEEIVKDYYYKHSEDSNIRNRCDMALSLLNSIKDVIE